MLGVSQLLTNLRECCRIVVVPINVPEAVQQVIQPLRINTAVFGHAIATTVLQIVELPARFCDADDRSFQLAALCQSLE